MTTPLLAFVEQSMASIATSFGHVRPQFIAAAVGFQAMNLLLRAVAWRGAVTAAYPDATLPVRRIGAMYAAGVAANSFLPARGGEGVKVGLLRAHLHGASVATLAGSSSVVLLFDMLVGSTLIVLAWMTGALPARPAFVPSIDVVASQPPLIAVTTATFALVLWRARQPLARFVRSMARGLAVVRRPGRYLHTVAAPQSSAWLCRLCAVAALLAAFGMPTSPRTAAMVVVLTGMSTLAAVPGGAGAQQVLVLYAFGKAVPTATALSFAIGMQVTVTTINCAIGVAAMMYLVGHAHPLVAIRTALARAHGTTETAPSEGGC